MLPGGAMKQDEPMKLCKDATNEPTDSSSGTAGLTEGTIDLTGMFSEGVSASGSFDLTAFRLKTTVKLLEAFPIPTFLVNAESEIVFANQACRRIDPSYQMAKYFPDLFLDSEAKERAASLIKDILSHRMPLMSEGILGTAGHTFRGRMHLRSVRMQRQRFALIMIEEIV
jgi:hypothetical protein